MTALPLLPPIEPLLLIVDQQAGLAFGAGSDDRQPLVGNTVALARTARLFNLPIVVSTSASRVYSDPLMPTIRASASKGQRPVDYRIRCSKSARELRVSRSNYFVIRNSLKIIVAIIRHNQTRYIFLHRAATGRTEEIKPAQMLPLIRREPSCPRGRISLSGLHEQPARGQC
ncbi:hypothetical protein [Sinorhizobium sp. RAC02]|uniref:hypothetical protein n=1 Tax=Sinorhizobium sp. RAC02 TaxID=1842534 RepID=UPI000A55375E|nr:hypothetical protein [Sinorhizobium sp. RAC02]